MLISEWHQARYANLQLNVFDISCIKFAQGDQSSPGVIPLAIKDVFSMIQDVSVLNNQYYSLYFSSFYPSFLVAIIFKRALLPYSLVSLVSSLI